MPAVAQARDYPSLSEADLVRFAQAGERGAFAAIMGRYNQRLFRAARSLTGDDGEAEDVLQEAYLRAFAAFGGFRGEASLSTWLTAIVINEARGRLRRRRTTVGLEAVEAAQQDSGSVVMFPSAFGAASPEADAARAEARRLLERAVDELPEPFRVVFIMREVDGLSVEDTAQALELRPETVKTRLHRARRMLRESLHEKLASAVKDAFPFLGARCGRVTERVLERLAPSYGWDGNGPAA